MYGIATTQCINQALEALVLAIATIMCAGGQPTIDAIFQVAKTTLKAETSTAYVFLHYPGTRRLVHYMLTGTDPTGAWSTQTRIHPWSLDRVLMDAAKQNYRAANPGMFPTNVSFHPSMGVSMEGRNMPGMKPATALTHDELIQLLDANVRKFAVSCRPMTKEVLDAAELLALEFERWSEENEPEFMPVKPAVLKTELAAAKAEAESLKAELAAAKAEAESLKAELAAANVGAKPEDHVATVRALVEQAPVPIPHDEVVAQLATQVSVPKADKSIKVALAPGTFWKALIGRLTSASVAPAAKTAPAVEQGWTLVGKR